MSKNYHAEGQKASAKNRADVIKDPIGTGVQDICGSGRLRPPSNPSDRAAYMGGWRNDQKQSKR
jgi:hypothetical protein